MILFGLHLNKPYLLLFDSRSWNDESWEVQLMRSSCQSRRCIQCWDLIDPKCWGFFCHFFVGIPMENLYHCIEQIDTTCDFFVWNWDFMGFFPDFWMWIGISNGSTTVISQFMFCIISTSVGGMITAAWWLSLSNSDPMIPKMINHLNHREILLPQPILPFWRMFCFHALIGKVAWGDHWKTQVNEKNKKKNDGDPDDDHDEEDDSFEFDASARLYACVKVQSAFSPRSTTRSTSRPTFFFGRFILPTNNKWKSFLSSAISMNFFLCNHCWWENSGIFRQAVALSHLLDPWNTARRCNKVLHPDGRCEKQKKPIKLHIPWSPWNTHLSELSWNKFWNSSRTSLLRLYMTSTYLYKLLRHRVKIDFLRATQAWRWSRDTAIMKRFWSVDKRMFWVCTFLLGTFP